MVTQAVTAAAAHTSGRTFEHANDVLVKSLRTYADRTLLHTSSGLTFTGAQLEQEIARCAATLQDRGIRLGTRVALLANNRVEVIFLQQALSILGAVFIPLHPMGTPEDFAHILTDAAVDLIVVDSERLDEVTSAKRLSGSSAPVLTLGGDGEDDLAQLSSREVAGQIELRQFDPEDICRVVYTGGTTGTPKASQLSYRSLSTMYGIQARDWEWPQEIRHLLVTPLSHVGGSSFVPTIARGGSLYVENGFDVVATLAAIQTHQITCIVLVPTMISAILDHPRLGEFDVSSLETVFYGASAFSPARLKAAIAYFGPIFFQFYGQAEAPTTIAIMRRAEHDVSSDLRLASCGRPVPEAAIRLVDENDNEVPPGEPGELCVRGPLLASGYLNKPEETAEALRGGWLHTGDIAVQDPDGFLRLVDRAKDLVITGGFNVYPRTVEDVLEEHPAVASACVFGVPDDYWGEALVAAVVRRDNAVSKADLIAYVRGRKGSVQTPKQIEWIDAIPTTAIGKPDKKLLRQAFSRDQTNGTKKSQRGSHG